MNFLKKMSWIVFKILLWIVGILAILYLIYGAAWECAMYKPLMATKFNKELWITAHGDNLERRCGMYHDLTRNHLKKGMSIKEVEELLGEIKDWGYSTDNKTKCAMHMMGVCYSNALSIVPMVLYTCFDRRYKLIKYDRSDPDKIKGWYTPKTKEQYCSKTGPQGLSFPTNDCGITDPW